MGRLYISLVASCLDASSLWQGPYVFLLLFLHRCWLLRQHTWTRCPLVRCGWNYGPCSTIVVQRAMILGFANRRALQKSEEAYDLSGKCNLPSLTSPALLSSPFLTESFFRVAGEEERGWTGVMLVKEPSPGGQGGQAEHRRVLFGRGEVRVIGR